MAGWERRNHRFPDKKCATCGEPFWRDRFVSDTYCSQACRIEGERYALLKEHIAHQEAQGKNLLEDWDRSQRIVAIGDVHFPWQSERACIKLFEFLDFFKPTIIIQMGDLYDMFSFGRWPRVMNITPRDEVKLGRQMALNFWKRIRLENKKAQLHQILGNHCDRPMKQLIAKMPEMEVFADTSEMFMFDGVQTNLDSKNELELAGIVFMHGFMKAGAHVRKNLAPTVRAHDHRGYVEFINIRDKVIWELGCGYVGDPTATPLKYREQKWHSWHHGCGVIDKFGPRFVPL